MKKFFFLAIAATALASCSSDELVELKEGDEIKFTAVADNDSRANTIFCNNNKMDQFQLYAATEAGGKFITDETYKVDGDVYKSITTNRYWPENDALDFYAIYNADVTVWNPGESLAGSFTPAGSVVDQKDFIYAVNEGIKKSDATNGTVALNFRHALSQIEFNAKNQNPNLKIEILGVKVGRVSATANYTIAATNEVKNTNGSIVDHTQAGPKTFNSLITWSDWTLNNGNYEIATSLTLNGNSVGDLSEVTTEGQNVDGEGAAYTKDYEKSMLLLPQTTAAWQPAVQNDKGAFLAVKVRIWNVLDDSEVLLYGDANGNKTIEDGEGRWAAVPVVIDWKEGHKYVYTFNFTDGGNAGYEDSNNDGEPENVAVLVPMSVSVTVDDFTNSTTTNKEMVK